jgi:AraC-like DNA-binding protein
MSKALKSGGGIVVQPSMVDVLSDVLAGLGLRTRLFCRSELTAPWALAFSSGAHAHFHFVERGRTWLHLEGESSRPMALAAGDLVVIPHGRGHMLSHSASRPNAKRALSPHSDSARCAVLRSRGDGPVSELVCGSFTLQQDAGQGLLKLLPDAMHLPAGSAGWLNATLDMLSSEARNPQPGNETVMSRLTDVLFVHVLRAWLDQRPELDGHWLGALRDPKIGTALALIHEAPEKQWTVGELGARVALSRAPFSARFTKRVGESPLAYLTRIRMERAARLLKETNAPLSRVTHSVGYASEPAFNKAFKRHVGLSPGEYRKRQTAASGTAKKNLTESLGS